MAFKIFMEDFHRNTVLGKAKVVVQIQGPSYWKMFFWTITGTHLGSIHSKDTITLTWKC